MATGADAFVGRDWERRELAAAIASAATNRGELVLLIGDAGIGKTRLAREAVSDAHTATAVWCACWEGGDAPPYWPWMQLARSLLAHAELPEDARRALWVLAPDTSRDPEGPVGPAEGQDPGTARALLFDAVVTLLREASRDVPVIAVFDDLHWADVPSLGLLRHVVSRLPELSVTIVGTYRQAEAKLDASRARLFATLEASARTLRLAGLSEEELGRLVATATVQELPTDGLAALARRTGGNPFFAKEVLRLLDAHGEASLASVPPTVIDVVAQRVARLPAGVHETLEVASVIGERFAAAAVTAAGLGAETVLDGLDRAGRGGLVHPAGDGFAFVHALVREALYESLGPARRASLHLRVADALGDAAEPAVLAHHLLAAAPVVGGERAIPHVLEAGEAALARLSHEDAESWFDRALDLIPPDGEERHRRALLGRAESRRRAGNRHGARADLDEVIAAARRAGGPADLARAALGIHNLGYRSGRSHREPIALLEEANHLLSDLGDIRLRASVLSALARELWDHARERGDDARAFAAEALALAEGSGSPSTLTRALEACYTVAWAPAGTAERLSIAERMVDAARSSGDDEHAAVAELLLGTAMIELGDARGLDVMEGFIADANRVGLPRMRFLALIRNAALAILRGDLASAKQQVDDVRALGEELDEPDAINSIGNLRWALARADGSFAALSGVELPAPGPGHVQLFAQVWRAVILDATGRDTEAREAFRGVASIPLAAVRRDWIFLYDMADMGAAAIRFGDLEAVRRARDALSPYAGMTCVAAAFGAWGGAIDHHLGSFALALGDAKGAVAHLEAAVALHEQFGARLWADSTRQLLARANLSVDASAPASLERDGRLWRLRWGAIETHMPDSKGVRDLAVLLSRPGTDVASIQLYEAQTADRGEPIIDTTAREAYRRRLAELDGELAEAEHDNDPSRGERAALERDALIDELRRNFDVHGRPRRLGDMSERARKAVTARIRDAIAAIDDVEPELGAHLRTAVRTGSYCSYRPG